ncbi:MAG: hypothetical protein R3E97_06475 [Candidatus Eisenbacteria bacterium]
MNVRARFTSRCQGSLPRLRARSLGTLAPPALATAVLAAAPAWAQDGAKPTPQPRESKTRIAVPLEKVRVDDGDTVVIVWAEGEEEIIRVLGIDTPETQHVEHRIPYDQPFGRRRPGSAGAFGLATSRDCSAPT